VRNNGRVSAEAHVLGGETLTEHFGHWPSFHDAEVQSLHLDSGQRTDGRSTLTAEIHLFEPTSEVDDGGSFVIRDHALVTLLFIDLSDVDLKWFAFQNVLDGLWIEEGPASHGKRLRVDLPSNHNLEGRFECAEVQLTDLVPFEPGPHSVYHRH